MVQWSALSELRRVGTYKAVQSGDKVELVFGMVVLCS